MTKYLENINIFYNLPIVINLIFNRKSPISKCKNDKIYSTYLLVENFVIKFISELICKINTLKKQIQILNIVLLCENNLVFKTFQVQLCILEENLTYSDKYQSDL